MQGSDFWVHQRQCLIHHRISIAHMGGILRGILRCSAFEITRSYGNKVSSKLLNDMMKLFRLVFMVRVSTNDLLKPVNKLTHRSNTGIISRLRKCVFKGNCASKIDLRSVQYKWLYSTIMDGRYWLFMLYIQICFIWSLLVKCPTPRTSLMLQRPCIHFLNVTLVSNIVRYIYTYIYYFCMGLG